MRIYRLKRTAIPKVAVLATGLAVALLAATVDPAPVAQAFPNYGTGCTGCHAAGGSVTATPSAASVAPGAAYTVALAFTGGSTPVGYAITGNGANVNASDAGPASMTAPAAVGSYTYTVWMRAGVVATTTYTITVGPVVTIPPTTVPPTTIPPTTVPPTTVPPTTIPPTTIPPTTIPPTTVPPTTIPPTTVPPVATTTIEKLSPNHGTAGDKVKIRGTGFGTAGEVMFGTVTAKVLSWDSTKIVVKVPAKSDEMVSLKSATVPVWYRHAERVPVTVTPEGDTASTGVMFTLDSAKGHHKGDRDRGHLSIRDIPGHHGLFEGSDD